MRYVFCMLTCYIFSPLAVSLPSYEISELLLPDNTNSVSINDFNSVAFSTPLSIHSNDSNTIGIWNSGNITSIDTSNFSAVNIVSSVNQTNNIAGSAFLLSDSIATPVTWDENGNPLILSSSYGAAYSINSIGQASGYIRGDTGNLNAVYWSNGIETLLFPNSSQLPSIARDINDNGEIIANLYDGTGIEEPYLFNGNVQLSLEMPAGSRAISINNNSVIAGFRGIPSQPRFIFESFIWDDGSVTYLDFLPGHKRSFAVDINDDGIVIGNSFVGIDSVEVGTAFRWDSVNGILNLNDLVQNMNSDGWSSLTDVRQINNNGVIVGEGIKQDGSKSYFVLTPIAPTNIIVDDAHPYADPLATWIPIYGDITFFIPGPGLNWLEENILNNAYANSYHRLNNSSNNGMPEFQWKFSVPNTGTYSIDAYWPDDSSATSNASFVVADSNGDTTVSMQQNINGGQWNFLGSFFFIQGHSYTVKLSAPGGQSVNADAIRISN